MNNLFLTSSFADVCDLLPEFTGNDLSGKTVTFIPTASIPESVRFYVKKGLESLEKLGLVVEVLEISQTSQGEIERILRKNDCIYVSGGNTFFLLQELKKKNADTVIADLIHKGMLYIGESAGSMILAPDIEFAQNMDSIKKAPELTCYEALNVLDFYPVPHYKCSPFTRKVEKILHQYEGSLDLRPFGNSEVIIMRGDDISIIKGR